MMPMNDDDPRAFRNEYRRVRGVNSHYVSKAGNYYEPNMFGELLVECWCGEALQLVQQLELLEGLTKPCSSRACRTTNELERARYRLRTEASA